MELDDFLAHLETATRELQMKQDTLYREHHLGSFPRWWSDQDPPRLQFLDEDGRVALEARVIQIGSYLPSNGTWQWAWANSNVVPPARREAHRIRELQALTGMQVFGHERPFKIEDECQAWEFAALAVKHLSAVGCYRTPSKTDGLMSFLALMSLRTFPPAERAACLHGSVPSQDALSERDDLG